MTEIRRYAVLTPFARADIIAAIAHLNHLDVWVVPTKSGVVVTRELEVPKYDEWDIRNITGPDPDEEPATPSDDAPYVAGLLSRLSPYGVVLIDVNLGDEGGFEEGVSGQVRARRFQAGEAGDEIPSGLLLNTVDPVVERIVLGESGAAEVGGTHSTDVTPEDLAALQGNTDEDDEDDEA